MPTLYGPNGRPLIVSTDRESLEEIPIGKRVAWEHVEQEVSKRVRGQATSLTQVWDPSRGKPKPTSITFETLRMISNRCEWASAIIKTRLNQIGRVGWAVKPQDEDDNSPSTKRLCEDVTKLLRHPSLHGSRPHSRSWRQFIGEILRDILVLDAGCIEKERNSHKWIVAMYPVDGATIQPNIDDRGGYHDDAYVQIVDGTVTARFGMEDLVYIMDNPMTDVRYAGYGYSPLEWLLVTVTAEMYASKYNASYFEKGSVPEGMINLGEDVAPEDVDGFRLYWMNEIMGKPWTLPIVGGKGVEWIPWRASNKDMEYMEYQQWLLKKACAVYQLPPQEVGDIEDVNRSTAEEQATSGKSKSLYPVLTLIEDYFEVEVIGDHGLGVGDLVKFEFDKEETDEAAVDRAFQIRVTGGAASRNEWREAVGMEPSEEEGADLLLVQGQLQGLPSEEDLQTLSATSQQQHEQELAEQQQDQGAGPGTMPWKPADASDPKFQAAQQQHDLSTGLGPRQTPEPPVQKTAGWHHALMDAAAPHLSEGKHSVVGLSSHAGARPYHHGTYGSLRSAQTQATKISNAEPHPNAYVVSHAGGQHVLRTGAYVMATRPASAPVQKTTDRNPALTDVHDNLEEQLTGAQDRLRRRLERILGIPIKPS